MRQTAALETREVYETINRNNIPRFRLDPDWTSPSLDDKTQSSSYEHFTHKSTKLAKLIDCD